MKAGRMTRSRDEERQSIGRLHNGRTARARIDSRPKNNSAGQSRREPVAPRSEIFLGFGKFDVASGQRPVVSFDAGIERVVGKFDTFGGALAIMGRPCQRVVHAASPEYAPSRCAKTDGTTIRAQDVKSSIESPPFTLRYSRVVTAAPPSAFQAGLTERWASWPVSARADTSPRKVHAGYCSG